MVSVVASFGISTTAHAHTELVSSTPAQGDAVPLQLDRVVLTFSTDLIAAGAAIVVRGPKGREAAVHDIGNLGNTVDAQLTLQTPGRHTLTYRVVGQDGHAIVGEFSFTAVAHSTRKPAVVSAAPSPSSKVTRRPEATSDATSVSSTPPWLTWWPVWTVLVGVLILLGHHRWRRRQRARI